MESILTIEQVGAIPTAEIARWTARLNRLNYALLEDRTVLVGHGEAGQAEWELAKIAKKNRDWQADKYFYEHAVLFRLKLFPSLTNRTLKEISLPAPKVDRSAKLGEVADSIGRIAFRDGLTRTGLVEKGRRGKLTMPLGALAAHCYERADIRSAVDRSLYARQPSIDSAVAAIELAAPARQISYEAEVYGEKRKIPVTTSVYDLAGYPQPGYAEKFGLNPTSSVPLWWQELYRDFVRIDAASESL